MKAICPISGVPFRTYDSLSLQVAHNHPIFSISFEQLVLLLEEIHKQEEQQLLNISEETVKQQEEAIKATVKDLTNLASEAIHEKNWRNPVFKLYQTKHLVMLALMKQAELLELEKGYAARPSPAIIDAFFWSATEIFAWATTISNPNLKAGLPKYRVSKQNENLDNFPEYLEILSEAKESIGARYRSISEENKLKTLEMAISILAKRRDAHKKNLDTSSNNLAARWAITITRAPKDIAPFWLAILASSSIKITFDGVKVGNEWLSVNAGDLRELRDFLEDNLIGPRGEHKQTHLDDSEYYFMARQVVLNIVRRHIAILEQGTSSFKIVNIQVGAEVLSASDDSLEKQGLAHGLNPKPQFKDYGKKLDFIRAMAAWRNDTKEKLIAIKTAANPQKESTKKSSAQFNIL